MVLAVAARRAGMFSRQYAPVILANSVRANIPMRLLSTSSAALAVRKASTTAPGTAKAQLENTRTKRCERCGAAIPIVASPCPRCLDVTPLEHEHVVDSLTHHAVLGFTIPRPLADGESPAAADWAELAQVPGRGFEVELDAIKRAKLRRLEELKPRKAHIEGPESATWRRLARNRIARAADILSDPAERAQYIARIAKRAREQTAEAEQKRIKAQFYEQKQQIHNKLDRSVLVAKVKENQDRIGEIRQRFVAALSAETPNIDTVIALQSELDTLYELEMVINKCMVPSK